MLVTCTIHSTEVGATQMAMEFVHDFATTEDPAKLAWMDDVILLLMPSINPDGQFLVIDWYNEQLGTEYEGGRHGISLGLIEEAERILTNPGGWKERGSRK